MKFKSLVMAALFTTLTIGAAHAGNNWFGVQGGMGIPSGDLSDAAGNGWNLGVTGTHMIDHQWGFGGDLAYNAWGGSDDANAAAEFLYGPGSELSYTAFQATGHAVAMFPSSSNVTPYAKVGLGIYNVAEKLSTPLGDEDFSESKFGYNFGGGMNFATQGNMKWGLNAAYHIVPVEGASWNYISAGVNLMWGVGQ